MHTAALFFIHRNFFARAMFDFPDDPLRSSFSPSFLATYRSAIFQLGLLRGVFAKRPQSLARMWPAWAKAISCFVSYARDALRLTIRANIRWKVILAAVSAKGRILSFSAAAFQELELSLALFEKIQGNPVIDHALVSSTSHHQLVTVFTIRITALFDEMASSSTRSATR